MPIKTIIKTAICSRIAVVVIQLIGNHIIKDHEAGVFLTPKTDTKYSIFDKIIQQTLSGFLRWDAQYFIHIAKYGYTYENTLAFFPLYPLLICTLSRLLLFLFPFVHVDSALLLTGLFINFCVFIAAALSLYKLSKIILFNEDLAFKSALLFCFNPATIFFSAPYTETLFVYLTFTGIANIIQLYEKYLNVANRIDVKDVVYIIPLSASTCTRSNGILNVGFLLYFFVCFYYYKVRSYKYKLSEFLLFTISTLIIIIVIICLCLMPFIFYQIYAYYLFCRDANIAFSENIIKYAVDNNFVLAGQFSKNNQTWCYQVFPFSYSYIQEHYWNVGFLRYFTVKQFPNFALAFPITFLILKCSFDFFKCHPSVLYNPFFGNERCKKFLPKSVFVFMMHALFLTVFNFFCIHVQVSTRILCSASPVLYWYCAFIFKKVSVNEMLQFNNNVKLNRLQIFVKYYFITYFIVGTVLFCNFLPWT